MGIPCDHELLKRLENAPVLKGTSAGGGFAFNLDLSVPYISLAIHAGHNVRGELIALMKISEKDRLFEEDPATEKMIGGCKNAIWVLDSRAEYDLNRPTELALPLTPERFWGVQVYREQPSEEMNKRSMEKFEEFYLFLGTYITLLIKRFGSCCIYDIHSYNISRQVEKGIESPPIFNLGTELLDRKLWGKKIDEWLQCLEEITIPDKNITVAENKVFSGKGELCKRLSSWDPNILVLPTEVSKIYMNEHTGTVYPDVVNNLSKGLQNAIIKHAGL